MNRLVSCVGLIKTPLQAGFLKPRFINISSSFTEWKGHNDRHYVLNNGHVHCEVPLVFAVSKDLQNSPMAERLNAFEAELADFKKQSNEAFETKVLKRLSKVEKRIKMIQEEAKGKLIQKKKVINSSTIAVEPMFDRPFETFEDNSMDVHSSEHVLKNKVGPLVAVDDVKETAKAEKFFADWFTPATSETPSDLTTLTCLKERLTRAEKEHASLQAKFDAELEKCDLEPNWDAKPFVSQEAWNAYDLEARKDKALEKCHEWANMENGLEAEIKSLKKQIETLESFCSGYHLVENLLEKEAKAKNEYLTQLKKFETMVLMPNGPELDHYEIQKLKIWDYLSSYKTNIDKAWNDYQAIKQDSYDNTKAEKALMKAKNHYNKLCKLFEDLKTCQDNIETCKNKKFAAFHENDDDKLETAIHDLKKLRQDEKAILEEVKNTFALA
ncbi:hypothetical protein L596_021868 [Steinernema carpocapsae]|uniref:Uncharacterized protein n=1 Tax=Steinernema carpocapsae TaxID=34508 RepID=A0A4U5MK32_STECR|nr:hypothetical protein L596_021868 [Steinernema carpocapsae]